MAGVKVRQPKPDSVDLEHLKQTIASHGWEMIVARWKQMIETHLQGLLVEDTPRQFYRTQGAISGLRRGLKVPEILADEIRQREVKKEKASAAQTR